MSNTIMGYYSCVYYSIMMRRYFKMEYINKLDKYYDIPKFFFTNTTHNKYEKVKERSIANQYKYLENRTNIFLTTCHDILEDIIALCKLNITNCLYINLMNKNYIHEIYKLRKKLIKELLFPKRLLLNIYSKFRNKNEGYLIGIHIRTSIYSDFREKSLRFYNSETEYKYIYAIEYILNKVKKKKFTLYIISDSTKIKNKFIKKYNKYIFKKINNYSERISHSINDLSIIEQYILSKCNVIIGSCASTYTFLSVFRYLNKFYAIEGLLYSGRGIIRGKCAYQLDYNHFLFDNKTIKI